MKILVLGDYEDVYHSSEAALRLKKKGYNISSVTRSVNTEEIVTLADKMDAIVLVRERTPLDRDTISRFSDVKIVSQTGKGTAHLDVDAINEYGIHLTTTPGGSTPSVVELTIGLMIGASRQFSLHQKMLKDGRWMQHPGVELHGKQLGILGYGKIGKEVARVGKAIGMKVKVWRPTGSMEEARRDNIEVGTLENVLQTSDVLSLHMRFSMEWKGFLNKDRLQMLKDQAIFVNTSRGGFVDEKALAELVRTQQLKGVGIDVFKEEPLVINSFKDCDNAILTPHIGYITIDALQRFAEAALTNIEDYFESK